MKTIFLFICVFLSSNLLAQRPTYINGISGDFLADRILINDINPFVYSDFYGYNPTKISQKDGLFDIAINLQKSKYVEIRAINSRSQLIFVTPGDSVSFVMDTIGMRNGRGAGMTKRG